MARHSHATSKHRKPGGGGLVSRASVTNLGAQGGALASVSVASLIVARIGGPTVVGEYALLRVLPWLFGVVLSCGLPTASAFFMAGDRAKDDRLRPTLALMTVAGSAIGVLAWLACAEPFHSIFFKQMPVRLVVVMSIVVVTQLFTVTAKGCCQGSGDIAGANLVIVAEELWFVLCYPVLLLTQGNKGVTSVVEALLISGTLATLTGVLRLAQKGFFSRWAAPSTALAKQIAAFGGRGQLGNMLWLMNLRFDFVLLGALAGPAVLGIYAVASKFAELMRLVPTAINYVLYPRFARLGMEQATTEARKLLPRATALTLVMAPFLAVLCYIALPILYGHAFRGAVIPAEIITAGLAIEGAAAVSSAFLLGGGRPGLNSVGMGVGATITVTLDIILIPRYGALGGAITSAITYVVTALVLTYIAHRVATSARPAPPPSPVPRARSIWLPPAANGQAETLGPAGLPTAGPQINAAADARLDVPARNAATRPTLRPDSLLRRGTDIVGACVGLVLAAPIVLAVVLVVKTSSRGPAIYRQVRAGRGGRPFTMLKFRSMVSGADSSGPLVSERADPRVTKVGAMLRATKLDELPQLVNVLRGDMTLIGPRPEVPHFLTHYDAEELGILRVRPGLTGPGQIFYTEVQEAEESTVTDPEARYVGFQLHPKLAIDLDYLRRRGFWLDLTIVARTVALISGLGSPAHVHLTSADALPMNAATQDGALP
jgi:lipopolysaccharide/colanic/teichoic acid biosynthesis glycosyltransferase/O-antigen/teichoic acid export membrane protein